MDEFSPLGEMERQAHCREQHRQAERRRTAQIAQQGQRRNTRGLFSRLLFGLGAWLVTCGARLQNHFGAKPNARTYPYLVQARGNGQEH